MSFKENGEVEAGFDIVNWITFPNQSFLRVKVGRMDPERPEGGEFYINETIITWHSRFNQVGPVWVFFFLGDNQLNLGLWSNI